MARKISVGTTLKTTEEFDRSIYLECVIHLVDPPIEIEGAEDMSRYLSEQIPEIWENFRYGDIIEDVSSNIHNIYGVTKRKQSDGEYLIKHGLEIVEFEERDSVRYIPKEFCIITRFPPGYHDCSFTITNNTYAPHYSVSQAEWEYAVPADLKKLKMDCLDNNIIFEHTVQVGRNKYDVSYVILSYRGENYIIATKGDDSDFKIRMQYEYIPAKWGIEAVESMGLKNKVLKLLAEDEIKIHNFLLI